MKTLLFPGRPHRLNRPFTAEEHSRILRSALDREAIEGQTRGKKFRGYMNTILTVIDNFTFSRTKETWLSVAGDDLFRFGEDVRRYAETFRLPRIDEKQFPIYLGGWPSANFWYATEGELVMSMLLYSGHVLVKDPISDWFSYEQYHLRKEYSDRQGLLDFNGRFDANKTRRFLNNVVPQVLRLRPLIEAGIVIPIPSYVHLNKIRREIDQGSGILAETLKSQSTEIANRFSPDEMTFSDVRKGMQVLMGGDTERQIENCIRNSARHFISEYRLAKDFGFNYTSVFDFESYLCEKGLSESLARTGSAKVIHALLNSDLPLYSGLTPDLIASVRGDGNFSEFRAGLYQLYRDVPIDSDHLNIKRSIEDAEAVLIRPHLDAIEKTNKRSNVLKRKISETNAAFKFGAGLSSFAFKEILQFSSGSAVLVAEAIKALTGLAFDKMKPEKLSGQSAIWNKLYLHSRSLSDEVSNIRAVLPQDNPTEIDASPRTKVGKWEFPPKGNTISVSAGSIIWDIPPPDNLPEVPIQEEGGPGSPYKPCGCGSGKKYKFCCSATGNRLIMKPQPIPALFR